MIFCEAVRSSFIQPGSKFTWEHVRAAGKTGLVLTGQTEQEAASHCATVRDTGLGRPAMGSGKIWMLARSHGRKEQK